jgi:multiple antibiotic resistance protein
VDLNLFGEVVVTLFVIVDPPGSVPIFLALTGTLDPRARNRAAWQAVLLSFGVITVFAAAGGQILAYLGIQLPSLQAAGGLLLLLVPLGTPLLAGPGAIVASILFVRRAEGVMDYVWIGLAIVVVHLIIYAFLRFSNLIVRVLRQGGIEVVTRIAGLLLAAIAVQLVADAIESFVRDYHG